MITTGHLIVIAGIIGFAIGYSMRRTEYVQFVISKDKEGNQIVRKVSMESSSADKAEFIEEPTQEDITEINKPTKLRKFLNKFSKPEE